MSAPRNVNSATKLIQRGDVVDGFEKDLVKRWKRISLPMKEAEPNPLTDP